MKPHGRPSLEEHLKTKSNRKSGTTLIRFGFGLVFIILLLIGIMGCTPKNTTPTTRIIVKASMTNVRVTISVTGTVYPKNRIEVKSPLAGRVESVLVNEGQYVLTGQTLAYMSSSERAAMLDSARAQGPAYLKDMEKIYKPFLIVSPMNGTVIVRNINPGQTISANDVSLVVSDKLIVQALIDETDIGHIKIGMPSIITLDAYPDVQIKGVVGRISYESKIVNNVTMYQADIYIDKVPDFVRSGMSASVDVIVKDSTSMILPKEAVKSGDRGTFVLVEKKEGERPEFRPIKIGTTTSTYIEIISGISTDDNILIVKNILKNGKKKKSNTVNPFMPQRPKANKNQQSGGQQGGGGPPPM